MSEEEPQIAMEEPEGTEVYTCKLCGVEQLNVPLKDRFYCEYCHEHLNQAYLWLQSPMLSKSELKEYQQKILDLTDINKIDFLK